MSKDSKEYLVCWAIEVDATSPIDAARIALAIQRDPSSMALHFSVAEKSDDGDALIDDEVFVDLMEEGTGVVH